MRKTVHGVALKFDTLSLCIGEKGGGDVVKLTVVTLKTFFLTLSYAIDFP